MRQLLATALLVLSPAAFGKCATDYYALSGMVQDASGQPVPNITLVVQWREYGNGLQQLETTVGPDGSYALTIPFNPYAGQSLFGAERCSATLASVTLQAGARSQVVTLTGQGTLADLVMAPPEPAP